MSALLELAERCEKATGPDRELDALIFRALARFPTGHWYQYGDTHLTDDLVPPVTASLDAAMTLVPEGWGWNVNQPNEKAIASGLLKERTPVRGEVEYGCDQRLIVAGATPALALTAAALRARASSQDHSLHGEGGL